MKLLLPDLKKPSIERLEPYAGLRATVHVFEPEQVDAVNLALTAGRPLLVRGEPGTGKSQLARAVAQKLGRAFLWITVDSQTEATSLLYRMDPVARLAKAQIHRALSDDGEETLKDALAVSRFVEPGPLWWAFDWAGAGAQADRAAAEMHVDRPDPLQSAEQGAVVLIDEIDKADAAVPNGLLEALGSDSFVVPCQADRVQVSDAAAPLVVVTTNEERALPDAFLRRCVVLHLALPDDPVKLQGFLEARGGAHFSDTECPPALRKRAAELVVTDRASVHLQGLMPPGQAEYLDLLRALTRLLQAGRSVAQVKDYLERSSQYVLDKHPRQSREPRP